MHLAWRWFTGLGFDQEIPQHSTFSKNRDGRFQESKLFEQLFEQIFFFFKQKTAYEIGLGIPADRSSDLIACKIRGLMVTVCPSQFATRRTLFHVLVGCGLLMLKVSRLKLPVIWLLVSMWLNTLTKSQIWTLLLKV